MSVNTLHKGDEDDDDDDDDDDNNNNNNKVYWRADSTTRWSVSQRAQIWIEGQKSTTYNIYISKTSKEKNKNIEKKRQIQAAKEETYNIS